MALWLTRTGKHGQHAARVFANDRLYLTWDRLSDDLRSHPTQPSMRTRLTALYPSASQNTISAWLSQIWAFAKEMSVEDWVIVPMKGQPYLAVAEIIGDYEHDASAEDPYFHSRRVKWIAKEVPRTVFDGDLLMSFGALLTICRIKRNDAEKRVRAMAVQGWASVAPPTSKPVPVTGKTLPNSVGNAGGTEQGADEGAESLLDLEQAGRDQITHLIATQFKGHDLTTLVAAILTAQGYTTYQSPPGPDQGVDILAAPGALGFGHPRICVQVKSQDSPVDAPTLQQLVGAMQHVNAGQGLLVSWGGFKSSVTKVEAAHFFRVRLWGPDDLMRELLSVYDKLDTDLRLRLPLKQVWVVATEES